MKSARSVPQDDHGRISAGGIDANDDIEAFEVYIDGSAVDRSLSQIHFSEDVGMDTKRSKMVETIRSQSLDFLERSLNRRPKKENSAKPKTTYLSLPKVLCCRRGPRISELQGLGLARAATCPEDYSFHQKPHIL